jgi:hypothetical protein
MASVESALKETTCKQIQEVRAVIQEMIVSNKLELCRQRQQPNRLLGRIEVIFFESMQALEPNALFIIG